MSSANPAQDNLTLFETTKLLLTEVKVLNAHVQQSLIQQGAIYDALQELNYMINGFTAGGASLNGYIPDAFVHAYVALLGPALAQRFAKDEMGIEELMKGGCLMARTLLEELAAYRSEQEARDVVQDALSNLVDPWQNEQLSE
jgi:hypothetical protein